MRVLAVDTAGPVAGVALACGDEVRVRVERVTRGAETRLHPWMHELCAEAGITLAQLDGVAVAAGPGAFTGLRVGLAAALGVATATQCLVFVGSSLDARAARLAHPGRVLSALDARKGRLYAAWYAAGSRVTEPVDEAPEVVLAGAAQPFVAVGEGALVYRQLVEAAGGRLVDEADHPGVDALARLGVAGLSAGCGVDPAQVRPTYLREADAKRPKPR